MGELAMGGFLLRVIAYLPGRAFRRLEFRIVAIALDQGRIDGDILLRHWTRNQTRDSGWRTIQHGPGNIARLRGTGWRYRACHHLCAD